MNGINAKDLLIAFLGFIAISFISKLVFVTLVANTTINIFPEDSLVPIYLGIVAAILVSGLATGRLIKWLCKLNPLSHTLIIAVFAALYKTVRPDLYPLSLVLVMVFSIMNFGAIGLGYYVSSTK